MLESINMTDRRVLTHLCIPFRFWDLGKQRRHRSDAAQRVWSGSTLFAYKHLYKNAIEIKIH